MPNQLCQELQSAQVAMLGAPECQSSRSKVGDPSMLGPPECPSSYARTSRVLKQLCQDLSAQVVCQDLQSAQIVMLGHPECSSSYARTSRVLKQLCQDIQSAQVAMLGHPECSSIYALSFQNIKVYSISAIYKTTYIVSLQSDCLKESDDFVILGVTFDPKMTFEKHLRSVSRPASQRLGILRKSWPGEYSMIDCFLGYALVVLSYPFWSTVLQCGAPLSIHTLNNWTPQSVMPFF